MAQSTRLAMSNVIQDQEQLALEIIAFLKTKKEELEQEQSQLNHNCLGENDKHFGSNYMSTAMESLDIIISKFDAKQKTQSKEFSDACQFFISSVNDFEEHRNGNATRVNCFMPVAGAILAASVIAIILLLTVVAPPVGGLVLWASIFGLCSITFLLAGLVVKRENNLASQFIDPANTVKEKIQQNFRLWSRPSISVCEFEPKVVTPEEGLIARMPHS